jgi:hypothetical protein
VKSLVCLIKQYSTKGREVGVQLHALADLPSLALLWIKHSHETQSLVTTLTELPSFKHILTGEFQVPRVHNPSNARKLWPIKPPVQ